jgi:hypothetical protein
MRLLPAIVVSLGAAAIGHAAEIAPGAVVSGDGQVAYLRVERGGIEARAVGQGGLLWRVADDLRPLAAQDGRVLCQRAAGEGRLDLVFLDAASGRPLAATTFALPEGVSSPLDEALGTRFDLRTVVDGPRVLLVWRFERRPVRGMEMEEEEEDEDREDGGSLTAEGAVSVDVARARAESAAVPPAVVAALPPAVEARAGKGELRQRPLRVGAFYVATRAAGEALTLERWSAAGAPLPPVALPNGVVLQLGSADGRHVLLSRELAGAPLARRTSGSSSRSTPARPPRCGRLSPRPASRRPADASWSCSKPGAIARPPAGATSRAAWRRSVRRALPPGRRRCAIPRITAPWPRRRAHEEGERPHVLRTRLLRRPRCRAAVRGRGAGVDALAQTRSAARTRSRGPAPARTASWRASRTVP